MTNKDKFKTAKEAWDAFKEYCPEIPCGKCPLIKRDAPCYFAWLYDEAPSTPQWKENIANKFTRKD